MGKWEAKDWEGVLHMLLIIVQGMLSLYSTFTLNKFMFLTH